MSALAIFTAFPRKQLQLCHLHPSQDLSELVIPVCLGLGTCCFTGKKVLVAPCECLTWSFLGMGFILSCAYNAAGGLGTALKIWDFVGLSSVHYRILQGFGLGGTLKLIPWAGTPPVSPPSIPGHPPVSQYPLQYPDALPAHP